MKLTAEQIVDVLDTLESRDPVIKREQKRIEFDGHANDLRNAENGRSCRKRGAKGAVMSYPMSTDRVPTRTVVLRGKMRRPKQKQSLTGEVLRRELTPPIQTDEERGQGDSINARLHRILNPKGR